MNDHKQGVNAPMLTLGQAAKEAGVSKATISKSLKSGRLSYVTKSPAGYEIDPAELFRVFPAKRNETHQPQRPETHQETLASEAYKRENDLLRQQLEEIRVDRDAWREQAQRLALSAPDSRPPSPARKIRWPWNRG